MCSLLVKCRTRRVAHTPECKAQRYAVWGLFLLATVSWWGGLGGAPPRISGGGWDLRPRMTFFVINGFIQGSIGVMDKGVRRSRWRRWWTGPRRGGCLYLGSGFSKGGSTHWRRKGGSFKLQCLIILMMMNLVCAFDLQSLHAGWIFKRAEEPALLLCTERLLRLGADFQKKVRTDDRGRGHKGNTDINAEAGQMIRVVDQVQLCILNAIRHKTKCQNCFRWLDSCH